MHDVVAYGPYPTEAFAQALNILQWPLVGFVRGLIHDEEQARDIVQDVFVDAWKLARQGSPPFTGAAPTMTTGYGAGSFMWPIVGQSRRIDAAKS